MSRVEKRLPNFLIVGAAKSGTTSLYKYLNKHPEVYLNEKVKESFFLTGLDFCNTNPDGGKYGHGILSDKCEYENLFKDTKNAIAIGEVCVGYLYFHKESIPNIKRYLGDPKIIIILRNPTDRAYSNYMHHVRDGYETCGFEEALELESEREKMNYWWGYSFRKTGMYSEQIEAYLNNFSSVKIFLFEDLQKDTESLIKNIFDFLEVNKNYTLQNLNKKYNVSGTPRIKFLHKILLVPDKIISISILKVVKYILPMNLFNRLRKNITKKNLRKVKMNHDTRAYLIDFYREDILKLQDLINRDLGHWLSLDEENNG